MSEDYEDFLREAYRDLRCAYAVANGLTLRTALKHQKQKHPDWERFIEVITRMRDDYREALREREDWVNRDSPIIPIKEVTDFTNNFKAGFERFETQVRLIRSHLCDSKTEEEAIFHFRRLKHLSDHFEVIIFESAIEDVAEWSEKNIELETALDEAAGASPDAVESGRGDGVVAEFERAPEWLMETIKTDVKGMTYCGVEIVRRGCLAPEAEETPRGGNDDDPRGGGAEDATRGGPGHRGGTGEARGVR